MSAFETLTPLLAEYLDPPHRPAARPHRPEPPEKIIPPPRNIVSRIVRFFARLLHVQSVEDRARIENQRRQADYARAQASWRNEIKRWEAQVHRLNGAHQRRIGRYRSNGASMRVKIGEHYYKEQWLPPHRTVKIPPADMIAVIDRWQRDPQYAAQLLFKMFLTIYKMPNRQLWEQETVILELQLDQR